MRNRMILLVAALLLITSSSALAKDKDKNKNDLRAYVQQLYDAWGTLDPSKAAPFYAQDDNLAFYDVAPMKYRGWPEYAAGVPKQFADYSAGKFTVGDDFQSRQKGDIAWTATSWRAELTKKDGTKQNLEGRHTLVLEKRAGKWLIVHEHMSVPMQ